MEDSYIGLLVGKYLTILSLTLLNFLHGSSLFSCSFSFSPSCCLLCLFLATSLFCLLGLFLRLGELSDLLISLLFPLYFLMWTLSFLLDFSHSFGCFPLFFSRILLSVIYVWACCCTCCYFTSFCLRLELSIAL